MMKEKIEAAIIDFWGDRCPESYPGCPTCDVWAYWDELCGGVGKESAIENYRMLFLELQKEFFDLQYIYQSLLK